MEAVLQQMGNERKRVSKILSDQSFCMQHILAISILIQMPVDQTMPFP